MLKRLYLPRSSFSASFNTDFNWSRALALYSIQYEIVNRRDSFEIDNSKVLKMFNCPNTYSLYCAKKKTFRIVRSQQNWKSASFHIFSPLINTDLWEQTSCATAGAAVGQFCSKTSYLTCSDRMHRKQSLLTMASPLIPLNCSGCFRMGSLILITAKAIMHQRTGGGGDTRGSCRFLFCTSEKNDFFFSTAATGSLISRFVGSFQMYNHLQSGHPPVNITIWLNGTLVIEVPQRAATAKIRGFFPKGWKPAFSQWNWSPKRDRPFQVSQVIHPA